MLRVCVFLMALAVVVLQAQASKIRAAATTGKTTPKAWVKITPNSVTDGPKVTALVAEHHKDKNLLTDFITGKECCGELGCFTILGDYWNLLRRPINFFPFCPLASGLLGLHLNTRSNPNATQILYYSDTETISKSNFDAKKKTKILLHGFTDNIRFPWWTRAVTELLKDGDYNVIRVDWSFGNTPPYTQATANIRVVGAYVGKFIEHVVTTYGAKADDFHIIGHSLGAHGAGYAGTFLKDRKLILGRITGLDPAGPYFTGMPPIVRLDPTDAKVVDTIVSDGSSILTLGFGTQQPMGHLNFYPNGGSNQPGCTNVPWVHGPTMNITDFGLFQKVSAFVLEEVACNHVRAVGLFVESINNPICAASFQCDSYENFQKGNCFSCKGKKCATFGYRVDPSLAVGNQTKKYYSITRDKSLYCSRSYKLTFSLQDTTATNYIGLERGTIFATLEGSTGVSPKLQLSPQLAEFNPGETKSYIFETSAALGTIKKMVFYWNAAVFPTMTGEQKSYLEVKDDFVLTDDNDNLIAFHPPNGGVIQDLEDVPMDASYFTVTK